MLHTQSSNFEGDSQSQSSQSEGSEDKTDSEFEIEGSTSLRVPPTPQVNTSRNPFTVETHPFTFQIASDNYFAQASIPSQTSSNFFSALVAPLSAEQYAVALNASPALSKNSPAIERLEQIHKTYFTHYLLELSQGFNIVFYGLGSKRKLLNSFAQESCATKGHVVVANAFSPNFSLKDLLASIENIPSLTSLPLAGSGLEAQTRRIYHFFSTHHHIISSQPLFLIIHGIESPTLRAPKAKSCLSLLAMSARIHIVASTHSINAPLLWSSADISTRKHLSPIEGSESASSRGYAWLWHDVTTLQSFDFELNYADRSSYMGISAAPNLPSIQGYPALSSGAPMTKNAAQHILASVTQKAKKLFALLSRRQLEAMEGDLSGAAGNPAQFQHYGASHDLLFAAARDDFIATNETALRALLGEFRDHGLILSGPSADGGEVLWIPLRKDILSDVLKALSTE